jgi:octaprenyl-diphosphate synthase
VLACEPVGFPLAGYSVDHIPVQSKITIEEALDVFSKSAISVDADRRVLERLLDVQSLVGDQLEWVQSALDSVTRDGVPPATEAAHHLVSRGGKRVRPLLVMLSAGCFGALNDDCRTLALVSELVHTSSLLHDDVTDEGMERRGVATSRRLWGNAVSVLAGDLLLVHALSLTSMEMPSVMAELLVTLRAMVDGEVLQLRGRTELLVSESHYYKVVRGKTASLFAWSARSGALSGGASQQRAGRLGSFGEKLGVAFQLVDDVLDYVGTATGKTSLTDLRDGKLTLPLVLAVQRFPELTEGLLEIHAGDLTRLDEVAARVVESGVCDEVRSRARALTREAIAELSVLGESPSLRLLKGVAEDLVARIG